MKNLTFYFDFLSPYSYFAWINHRNHLSDYDLDISYKPVLMGKLFSHNSFPGPGEIPNKRKYELKRCFRYAAKNNIPFSPPAQFPFNPMAIIRMATLAATESKEEQITVIDKIFQAVWGEGLILEDPELIQQVCENKNIAPSVIENSFNREAKTELKTNIKEAINADIFGVPSFKIEDEFFWGNDSFEFLIDLLEGNDNWNKKLYNELLQS